MTWVPLFEPQCEKVLKQIADNHTDLFEDILHVFGARPAKTSFSSDISLILYPLPRTPILICYTKQEDELESKLNVFLTPRRKIILTFDQSMVLPQGL